MEGSPPAPSAPATAEAAVSKPSPPKASPRWPIIIGALVLASILVTGTVLVVGPSSPWVEAVLAQGHATLDVPLTTMYTAPALANGTVTTSVTMSFASGNGTCITNQTTRVSSCGGSFGDVLPYTWSIVRGTDLPVHFVMSPEPSPFDTHRRFDDGSWSGLLYLPAGPTVFHTYPEGTAVPPPVVDYLNATATGAGLAYVYVTTWAMNYTVRKMGVFQGLTSASYLEVDYSMAVVDPGSLRPLPAANVSLPSSTDLWSPVHTLTWEAGQTLAWNGISVLASFNVPPPPVPYGALSYFHENLTPLSLDLGSAESLVVGLRSSYDASYATLFFSSDRTVQVHFSVDMRFGSLMLAYGPGGA